MQLKAFSSEDISDVMFAPENLKELDPEGATFVMGNQTKYDGQPGAMTVLEMDSERAGFRSRNHMLTHMFLYSGKLVSVRCSVSGLSENATLLRGVFEKNVFLFQMIGNGFFIQSHALINRKFYIEDLFEQNQVHKTNN